ncbi:TPA: restriction endonuclease subunit S [Vibrio alginolyticus]
MTGRYKAYPEYKNTAIDWLGNVPSHWTVARLKNALRIKNGRDYKDVEVSTDGYPVYGSGGIFKRSSHYLYDGESVLFGRKGTVDKPLLVNGKFWTVDTMFYSEIAPRMDARFIHNQAMLFPYNLLSTNTALPSMTQEDLLELGFVYPSFEEQQNIANFLDHETAKIDTLIDKQEKLIELLKEKRQAVISHAVTKGLNPDAPMKASGVEWLGEVPEHWTVGRVKNLAKLISKGTTPSTIGGDFIDEGIRFLKGENIGKSLFVNPSPTFYISEEVDAQLSRSRLQENDVLVIIAGATTGKASILTKELLPANTNQAVSFIRPKKAIYSKLITLWLSTEFAQRIIWMGAVQAAQPNLSMENLGNLPIVLPDEVEIAPLLNEIDKKVEQFDALIIKANSAIELMKERKTALISAAVTGKIDVRDWEPK